MYQLNLDKTELGSYSHEIDLYRDLKVSFFEDSTYLFSKAVPFIDDSVGKWLAGDGSPESWGYMYEEKYNPEASTQFSECCSEDSTFMMNSVTPRPGNDAVNKIWFTKIRSKPVRF